MLYDGELQRLEALEMRLGTTFGQLTLILPTSVRSRTFDSPVAGTMPVPPRPTFLRLYRIRRAPFPIPTLTLEGPPLDLTTL